MAKSGPISRIQPLRGRPLPGPPLRGRHSRGRPGRSLCVAPLKAIRIQPFRGRPFSREPPLRGRPRRGRPLRGRPGRPLCVAPLKEELRESMWPFSGGHTLERVPPEIGHRPNLKHTFYVNNLTWQNPAQFLGFSPCGEGPLRAEGPLRDKAP